ncbi:hypothetical protein PHLGIDRAFT_10375 [Phlebiopsis gigantea 11061_1 CR5-6]|uniref:Uncharacterized protein n=1 Tax=Phlebiopsis gigantea (strain 11061_1 CR5-6) TaxID=745531 RepID=A0A0C3SDH5_PHLG1|nr:hypothetical protein PHLGIDRAFT_10375 [Phlebiopsis gigantea 11061_1 CR5-6]
MESFSWSDNLRAALAPCLGCFNGRTDEGDEDERAQFSHHRATSHRGPDYVPRARPDELEGLLADSDDAETLSLHSNLGHDDARRRKRRRTHKLIRFFGFDLFGKPPVQLPEDDDDDVGAPSPRLRNVSASTLDSDASPLDPSTIDRLSAARAAEDEARLALERRSKAERKRRRRERKVARNDALALALDNADGEFEGFPGSGGSNLQSPDPTSSSGYDESEEFGPFAHAQTLDTSLDHADVEGVDFGAEAYAKLPRRGDSSGTGSDSRSRTSGTHSHTDSVQYDYSPARPGSQTTVPGAPRRKKSSRQSTSSASQSISVPSTPAQYTMFSTVAPSPLVEEVVPSDQPIITIDTPNGFPTVGFGGGMRRKNSEAGVFLANRGE